MEMENPDMLIGKKKAIATTLAKRVSENKNPCWDSHEMDAMKTTNDNEVSNCFSENEKTVEEDKNLPVGKMITSVEINISSKFGNKFKDYWTTGMELVSGYEWSFALQEDLIQIFGTQVSLNWNDSQIVIHMEDPIKIKNYNSILNEIFAPTNTSISKFKRDLKAANLQIDDKKTYWGELIGFCYDYGYLVPMAVFVGVLHESKNQNEYEKLVSSGPGAIKVTYKYITSKTINGKVIKEGL